MDLDGRVAVVTGGGRGIGRAIAEAFTAAGARVVVCDLDQADCDRVAAEIGGGTIGTAGELGAGAMGIAADVTDEASLARVLERATAEVGTIDVVVSNAGIATGQGVDADDATWQRTWAVNVGAHVSMARLALPAMLARGEGYVVSVASAAGLLANIGDAPYTVTKHAAVGLAEWLAITYGDRGIRVSCVCPQGVNTDLLGMGLGSAGGGAANTVAAQGVIEPEVVADALVAAMAEERFLVLPHPEVADYQQRKVTDPDRWLAGMRKLQARFTGG